MSGTDVIMVDRPAEPVAEGVWTLGGQGNSMVVDMGEGLLLVDAGPGGAKTDAMIASLREVSAKPVTHLVISHGHLGYNFGVAQWRAHAVARGEPVPVLIGHERVPVRYRRYAETAGLQSYTNTRQFRTAYPEQWPSHWFTAPDQTYRDRLLLKGTQRDVELFHAPSETDDTTAVWLPAQRVLYGSAAFIKSCPNAGTPFRTLRDPMRWCDTLEGFLARRPAILIPEFGRPLTEAAEIEEALTVPIRAFRWLRTEVVARMNRGMTDVEILNDLQYPEEIFGHRYMKPGYGCPDYIVRDIWRTENGWWDRNPTSLHPSAPTKVADEVLALVDPQRVIERAEVLRRQGQTQMALHVIDLVALAADDTPDVARAKALKAALLMERSGQQTSAVSRQIMRSEAELLQGLPIGASEGQDVSRGGAWT